MCYALPTGWRPPVGRLAFLFFTPPRTRCFHISQAPQAKQTNRPVVTVTRKLRWWPEPWQGHTARTTWPPAGGPFDSSICRKENSRFLESENSQTPPDLVVKHWTSDGESSSHRDVLLLH